MQSIDLLKNTGICVFDAEGRFLYANDAFYALQGTKPGFYKDLTPRKLHELKLIDKCILDSVYETQSPVTDIQTIMNRQGRVLKKQLVSIYPIFDSNNKIQNAIAYYQDASSLNDGTPPSPRPRPKAKPAKALIMESKSMKSLYAAAARAAATDSTILITGETGTGKEVLAKYVHVSSPRADRKMITVDCTALPPSLIEAELFGYEKGSFTGASSGKEGLIEAADKGTLFLDEINSLPLSAQSKLLRAIEERSIKRIGSLNARKVDFRLIAASNADLYHCVQRGEFRADLYYRLNIIPLNIPPLREHREDIAPLIRYFSRYFMDRYNTKGTFSESIYRDLETRD